MNINAYCIQSPENEMYLDSIRLKKTACINHFMEGTVKGYLWRHYRDLGWKCKKITITT